MQTPKRDYGLAVRQSVTICLPEIQGDYQTVIVQLAAGLHQSGVVDPRLQQFAVELAGWAGFGTALIPADSGTATFGPYLCELPSRLMAVSMEPRRLALNGSRAFFEDTNFSESLVAAFEQFVGW